jgi:hypothetical protein
LDASLSQVSKKIYLGRLKVLLQEQKKDIYTLITDPKTTLQWLEEKYPSEQTRKSYISAILAVFRHNKGLKEQEEDAYKVWYAAFSDIHNAIEERYKRNEPTQKQKDVYVPFQDIVKARDELDKGSDERLLLSMYTYMPPLRCDFNKVRIYRATLPQDHEPNYIHMHGDETKLVLHEFKTQGKVNRYEKVLPEALVSELRDSLQHHPRTWLFLDKNGNPFSAKTYTQWANRILAKVLKKKMTVSMIRHSFINSLDFNKLTVAEKEAIAKDMAHTIGTQDRYRLIFNP